MADGTPTISVVMTTYKDAPASLGRAISSILNQTFSDLECIVVFETGDPNFDLVSQKYEDPRLVAVRRDPPRNRNACHNYGLALAKGRYIARMDGDDYSFPERLERQLDYLQKNPNVGLVGTAGRLVNDLGQVLATRIFPCTHAAIMRGFILTNPIFHPSVMWDTMIVGRDLRYHSEFFAEDLELWLQMLQRGAIFANLSTPLIDYEMPPQYTRPKANWQTNFRVRVRHWRLCLSYPVLVIGIIAHGLMSILPIRIIDMLTRRNCVSDRLRSIYDGSAQSKNVTGGV